MDKPKNGLCAIRKPVRRKATCDKANMAKRANNFSAPTTCIVGNGRVISIDLMIQSSDKARTIEIQVRAWRAVLGATPVYAVHAGVIGQREQYHGDDLVPAVAAQPAG